MSVQDLIQNFKTIITKKYFCFEGRATRSEFWKYVLVQFIINFILAIVDGVIGIPVLSPLFILATFFPTLGCTVRRLHDTGKSAWWLLLGLIPFGGLVLLYFYILPGNPEANSYGDAVK